MTDTDHDTRPCREAGEHRSTQRHARTECDAIAASEDLTTATPPQIDTQIAALTRDLALLSRRIESHMDTLHRLAGDDRRYIGRRHVWTMLDYDAEAAVRTRLTDGVYAVRPWDERQARETLAALDAIRRVDVPRIQSELRPLETEYRARRWSRFFLVTSSTGGHIHSSMNCSTCRITTDFGWLPDLSGRTEADAVAEHGPLLCSVCFPTAPVEWTMGKPKPVGCAGSGKQHIDGTYRRRGMTSYGKCPECNTTQVLTMSGGVRKHKPATT